jgi:hypothetical protein
MTDKEKKDVSSIAKSETKESEIRTIYVMYRCVYDRIEKELRFDHNYYLTEKDAWQSTLRLRPEKDTSCDDPHVFAFKTNRPLSNFGLK